MMVIFFVGTGGAAIATGLTDGPVALALGLAAIGLFGSIYHPVGTAWLVRNARNRGRALGATALPAASASLQRRSSPARWRRRSAGAPRSSYRERCAPRPGRFCSAVVRGGNVVAAAVDRRPEPEASRNDMIRTFIVLSFTMLADGTISQSITVALPKAFAAGIDRPYRWRNARRRRVCHLGVSGRGDRSIGGRLARRSLCDEGGLCPCLGGSGPALLCRDAGARCPAARRDDRGQLSRRAVDPGGECAARALQRRRVAGHRLGAKFLLALGVSTIGVKLVAVIYDGTGSFAPLWLTLAGCAGFVALAGLFLPGRLRRTAPIFTPQPAE